MATLSFVIQLVVLGLLSGAVWLKTMKKFRQHGITMLTALVLHAVIVLAWMIPIFSSLFNSSSSINFADTITAIILVHAFMGVMTIILGIWLVASWRLRAEIKTCFAKKNFMRVTITLWLTALVLGNILYLKIIQIF